MKTNKKLIHHSASGINEYFVECYYRHTERVWVFETEGVKKVCPHPSQEYLNIYYDGDLMKWRDAQVAETYASLLIQRALRECDYCASSKASRVNWKIAKNSKVEIHRTPKVVEALFAKHLLEKGDYACLFKITVSWSCDAWYSKSK